MSAASKEESNNPLVELLVSIRTSFTRFVITVGLSMLVVALVIEEGVGAAMIGTVGVSAIVFGIVGRLGLRAIGYT
jgi:hypothetical protein